MMALPLRALPVLVLTAVLAGCVGSGAGSIGVATSFNVTTWEPERRRAAPSFEGEVLVGEGTLSDRIFAGTVGVVNFWGSWCGPCRAEQAELEALWKRYAPLDVRFVGINTRRDQRAAALAFLEEFDVTYPSVYDPPSRIASAFRVRVMPMTFVIDREGRIAAQIVGALRSEEDLARLLDAELSR